MCDQSELLGPFRYKSEYLEFFKLYRKGPRSCDFPLQTCMTSWHVYPDALPCSCVSDRRMLSSLTLGILGVGSISTKSKNHLCVCGKGGGSLNIFID